MTEGRSRWRDHIADPALRRRQAGRHGHVPVQSDARLLVSTAVVAGLRPSQECRMWHHLAGGHLAGHQEAEHALVRRTMPGYARILPESETAVEGWISDQNTPAGSPRAQRIKTGFDQRASYPLALAGWLDRHRPEQKPARRRTADIRRREGDMAHYLAVRLSDERQLQGVGHPQCLHNEMFCLLTVGVTLEGDDVDLADAVEIPIGLWANNHADLL